MAGLEQTVTIGARYVEIRTAIAFIERVALQAGLDDESIHRCHLALDEACANIIEHGYGAEDGTLTIQIVCFVYQTGCLVIEIIDSAAPFNPLALRDPDPGIDPIHREPGGWGVYFIRNLMDAVDYRYLDGHNRLTLVKCRDSGNQMPIPIRQHENVVVSAYPKDVWSVAPQGRLDAASVIQFDQLLTTQIDSGHVRLIIDLSAVDYVSTSGWKALLSARQRAHNAKGDVTIMGLSSTLQETLCLLGLDLVFVVHLTLADALAYYCNPKHSG